MSFKPVFNQIHNASPINHELITYICNTSCQRLIVTSPPQQHHCNSNRPFLAPQIHFGGRRATMAEDCWFESISDFEDQTYFNSPFLRQGEDNNLLFDNECGIRLDGILSPYDLLAMGMGSSPADYIDPGAQLIPTDTPPAPSWSLANPQSSSQPCPEISFPISRGLAAPVESPDFANLRNLALCNSFEGIKQEQTTFEASSYNLADFLALDTNVELMECKPYQLKNDNIPALPPHWSPNRDDHIILPERPQQHVAQQQLPPQVPSPSPIASNISLDDTCSIMSSLDVSTETWYTSSPLPVLVPEVTPLDQEVDGRSATKEHDPEQTNTRVRKRLPSLSLPSPESQQKPKRQRYKREKKPASRSSSPMMFRNRKDELLVRGRQAGLTYKAIKAHNNFPEAESTMRGRYRTLTKEKEERVRRPEWTETDVNLLHTAVDELRSAKRKNGGRIPWKIIGQYIHKNGGSYSFGSATCRKKWDEIVKAQSM